MAAQIESIIHNVPTDPLARRELHEAAKRLVTATESEPDMRHNMQNHAIVPAVATQIALNLGLIDDLVADSSKEWSVEELSTRYNASPMILARLLRMLSAYGFIAQTSKDTYKANARTQRVSEPASKANVEWFNLVVNNAVHALPDHLAKTKYRSIKDDEGLAAVSTALNTKEQPFEYMIQQPRVAKAMLEYMATHRDGQPGPWDGCIDLSEFKLASADVESGRVCLVDVGGGSGHQAIQFRQKQPQLKGKIVVEDLPHQIDQVDANSLKAFNIEPLAHDFTAPQPIKNAKVYYMRCILHDWQDEQCHTILSQLRDAMADDSIIAIDEVIIQSTNASELATGYDLIMMSIGSVERTEEDWQELLAAVGLRIKAVQIYDEAAPYGLIIACKA